MYPKKGFSQSTFGILRLPIHCYAMTPEKLSFSINKSLQTIDLKLKKIVTETQRYKAQLGRKMQTEDSGLIMLYSTA